MLPLQLWIHLSKSLEISHEEYEEDRDKRESTQSVRAWRCRALMWVFISIQIDPVIIFSQDFLLQLILWLVSGHRHLLRLQMVSNDYYKGEKLYNLTGYVWTSIASKSVFNNAEFRRFFDGNSRTDVISFMKMMEHLKIHVQCKRHRLLFPTESQSHWLHWLGFLPVCAFSHSSHVFYVDYFQRSLEGVSPNIYKTTQLAHFGLLTTMVAFVCDISTVFLQMLSQIIHPRR